MGHVQEERWKALCLEASTENDPEKLFELISEINRLIEDKNQTGKSIDEPAS
jgi:hypothetical protein